MQHVMEPPEAQLGRHPNPAPDARLDIPNADLELAHVGEIEERLPEHPTAIVPPPAGTAWGWLAGSLTWSLARAAGLRSRRRECARGRAHCGARERHLRPLSRKFATGSRPRPKGMPDYLALRCDR
jgi:hypothetical protein